MKMRKATVGMSILFIGGLMLAGCGDKSVTQPVSQGAVQPVGTSGPPPNSPGSVQSFNRTSGQRHEDASAQQARADKRFN